MAGWLSFLPWLAGAAAFVRADLPGCGSIEVPSRLEARQPQEADDAMLVRFDRVVDSFFYMGSSTPFRERLVVACWRNPDAKAKPAWEGEFQYLARDRVEDIRWLRDGQFEVGTGTHRVNTRDNPARVLILELPGRRLRLGYMAWQKDVSLQDAKALLERVAASFVPAKLP